MKNQTITVEITTIDNITSKLKFENLKLSYTKDHELKFVLPIKTKEIKIKLTGEIKDYGTMSEKKVIEFDNYKTN